MNCILRIRVHTEIPRTLFAAMILFFGLGVRSGVAQDDRGNRGWFAIVTPYYAASNIGGAVTLGFPAAAQLVGGLRISLGDTVLEDSWAGRVEVGRGRVRAIASIASARIARSTSFASVVNRADTVLGAYDFAWTTVELFWSLAVGPFDPAHSIELFAGARYQRWNQTITTNGQATSTGFIEDWVDPVVGGRGWTELGSRWWAQFSADLGGFGIGIGPASQGSWELGGEVGFRLTRFFDLTMRYNYMEVEFDNGQSGAATFSWENGVAQGWFLGAAIKL